MFEYQNFFIFQNIAKRCSIVAFWYIRLSNWPSRSSYKIEAYRPYRLIIRTGSESISWGTPLHFILFDKYDWNHWNIINFTSATTPEIKRRHTVLFSVRVQTFFKCKFQFSPLNPSFSLADTFLPVSKNRHHPIYLQPAAGLHLPHWHTHTAR